VLASRVENSPSQRSCRRKRHARRRSPRSRNDQEWPVSVIEGGIAARRDRSRSEIRIGTQPRPSQVRVAVSLSPKPHSDDRRERAPPPSRVLQGMRPPAQKIRLAPSPFALPTLSPTSRPPFAREANEQAKIRKYARHRIRINAGGHAGRLPCPPLSDIRLTIRQRRSKPAAVSRSATAPEIPQPGNRGARSRAEQVPNSPLKAPKVTWQGLAEAVPTVPEAPDDA